MFARRGRFGPAVAKSVVAFAAASALPFAAAAATTARPVPASNVCAAAAASQESAFGIPAQLLHAISIVESGRPDPRSGNPVAWPWTVRAEGRGRFYATKSAAIRAVAALRRKGVRNIDIGCMQINLLYHPNAFRSLEEAFDPDTNVACGARLRAKLRREKRSWTEAVKYYHSATRALHAPYRDKVYAVWRAARRAVRHAQRKAGAGSNRQGATPGPAIARQTGIVRTRFAWPPRNVAEQRRLEHLARAWAMSPRRR